MGRALLPEWRNVKDEVELVVSVDTRQSDLSSGRLLPIFAINSHRLITKSYPFIRNHFKYIVLHAFIVLF